MTKTPRARRPTAAAPRQERAAPRTRQPKEIEFVVCPLCTRTRVLEVTNPDLIAMGRGRAEWDLFDPETSALVQIRVGGGKKPSAGTPGRHYPGSAPGSGFHVVKTLTWKEAQANPRYRDQVQAIIERLHHLLRFVETP